MRYTERVPVLDHGYVQYVEHCGSDQSIIEAARMSTSKGFLGWGEPCHACCNHGVNPACTDCHGTMAVGGDERLLRRLWVDRHLSPFEMADLTIEVQAPIFVFREWHRHRTQSYNEMSGRYAVLPDLTYVPSRPRLMASAQSTTNKQSSTSGFDYDAAERFQRAIVGAHEAARRTYEGLIAAGVAREVARGVLPVAQYSRMRAKANLRNWLAFLALRMPPDAQWEIRQYANAVHAILTELFPRTMVLFDNDQPRGVK